MNANVETLLNKAASANEPQYAMQFAQAALNAAHALQVMKQVDQQTA